MQYYFLYTVFIFPIIYIFPAYAANGAPVLFGGKKPLDFGKHFMGKRIFGNNKNIEGLIAALVAGTIVGLIEYPFFHYMLAIAIVLSIGTMAGDLFGSFIKRRLDVPSGKSVMLLDQYGFLIFALVFAYPLGHMPSVYGILFLIILTGVAHILTNRGAYKLKLKKVPW
jgi:CDP-2,3-bis-(O-geranylgeranyl)-sn-glycerol synthase